MRRIPYLLLICFSLLSRVSYVEPADLDLFTDPMGTVQVDLKPVNSAVVVRQRLVNVRFDLLSEGNEDILTINLFDDVRLTANRDRLERITSDGFAWIGYVSEIPGGQVTLVVEGQRMAGTVILPDISYHVRNADKGLHVVRELSPSAFALPSIRIEGAPQSFETEVVALVNQERAVESLYLLSWDDRLFEAARGHSEDMAQQNYFSHDSLDGRSFSQRITEAGYFWNTCGENIAAGYSTAQAVVNVWMNSPGHRANMMSTTFCDIGVGYAYEGGSSYGYYWTQDFGREQDVNSCSVGNLEPIASFTANPTSGQVPLPVSFDGSASSDLDGNIVSYSWNFGDGTIGQGETVTHAFNATGSYTITLTVTDNDGATDTLTETDYIAVTGVPPLQYTLTVDTIGQGSVTLVPDGEIFDSGTVVQLTATPHVGWAFEGWDGDLTGSDNPGTVVMDSNKTVTATFREDIDGDGISDEEEEGCPNGGDGNYDGTADSQQDNVTSLHTHDDKNYVTLVSPDNATLSNVKAVSVTDTPFQVEFPYGVFQFIVNSLAPGASTTVSLILPDGVTPSTYYKYGPTPQTPASHWYEFLYDGKTGAEIDGNVITLHFADGLRGDDDLDRNNGAIVDLGGPGFTRAGAPTTSSGGGSGGGCFIATAVSSSP